MKRIKPYLEVFPVVFTVLFILMTGIFGALLTSLGYFPAIGMKNITFQYYMEVFRSTSFIKSAAFSVYTTAISSISAVILGVMLARFMVEVNGRFEIFYKIPVIIPHITVCLFAIIFLSETGLIPRILYAIGIKNAQELFSNFLFNPNGAGIISAYIWKETPFVLLSTLAVMKRISRKHENAAVNLGATRIYSFFKVTLPMILPSIISSFTIIFAFSFGSYEVPMLLGATVPKALPVQAFIEYQNPDMSNRPVAMAYNIIIILMCTVLVMLFAYVIKKIVSGEKDRL